MKLPHFGNCCNPLKYIGYAAISYIPALANAHPGHFHPGEEDEFDAFTVGILHPLSGIDHLLLALAVGWLSFSLAKGKGVHAAASFLLSVLMGAIAGQRFLPNGLWETLVAFTLIAVGVFYLTKKATAPHLACAAVGAAGFVHGVSHGIEGVSGGGFFGYASGILVSSAVLVLAGGILASAASGVALSVRIRLAAMVLVSAGSVFLFNAI